MNQRLTWSNILGMSPLKPSIARWILLDHGHWRLSSNIGGIHNRYGSWPSNATLHNRCGQVWNSHGRMTNKGLRLVTDVYLQKRQDEVYEVSYLDNLLVRVYPDGREALILDPSYRRLGSGPQNRQGHLTGVGYGWKNSSEIKISCIDNSILHLPITPQMELPVRNGYPLTKDGKEWAEGRINNSWRIEIPRSLEESERGPLMERLRLAIGLINPGIGWFSCSIEHLEPTGRLVLRFPYSSNSIEMRATVRAWLVKECRRLKLTLPPSRWQKF